MGMTSKFNASVTVFNKIGNTANFKVHRVENTLVVPAVNTLITGVALSNSDTIVVYMPYKYLNAQGYLEPSKYTDDMEANFTFRAGDYIDTKAEDYKDDVISIANLKKLHRVTGVQSYNFGAIPILVVTLQ